METADITTEGRAHKCLREATRHAHNLLDQRFDTSMFSNRDGYAEFLLMNWPSVSIELGLENAGVRRVLPDWDQRRRRDALAADLAHLGISAPPPFTLDIAADDGSLLGWSYVLEGSRLGAKLILKLVSSGGMQDIRSVTGFVNHGAGKDYWKNFKLALARIDLDEDAISSACAGAEAAFRCFQREPMRLP